MHLEIHLSQCHSVDHKPHTDKTYFPTGISFYIHSRNVKYAADLVPLVKRETQYYYRVWLIDWMTFDDAMKWE